MPEAMQSEHGQAVEPVLDYGCSPWTTSTQQAADLYGSGVKLWRKEDFVDIERQLAQSYTAEKFTVRRLDGSFVHIRNPMFGVQTPIWKPYVKIQEYWRLVRSKPDGPPETYHCTYLVDWTNQTLKNYKGPVENFRLHFAATQARWDASETCQAFKTQCRKLLGRHGARKVTKIVCFGLGDMNFKPPDWFIVENASKPKSEQDPESSDIEDSLTHHAIALTMADIARSYIQTGDIGIRLLTQDPSYSTETKDLLHELGFEVVGEFGVGGFADLDDETIVISTFTAAPVKQIVADFARPAAIITNRVTAADVYGQPKTPYSDPESPRTKQMWKEYEAWDFPTPAESVKLEGSLRQLALYVRVGE